MTAGIRKIRVGSTPAVTAETPSLQGLFGAGNSSASGSTVGVLQTMSAPEPRTRTDFLQYVCRLTLDPNTVNHFLDLSVNNREVEFNVYGSHYPDHPERFGGSELQVLSKESVCGRAYWEVEWIGGVFISVSYKGIGRKGRNMCRFGCNDQSWSLECSLSPSFWHNNIQTRLPHWPSSRIGVYVDHSAGTLSFYNISPIMTLLHTVHTTFTQPLYAGFRVGGSVKLCDL